jgi:hypothetical protein
MLASNVIDQIAFNHSVSYKILTIAKRQKKRSKLVYYIILAAGFIGRIVFSEPIPYIYLTTALGYRG